LNHLSYTGQQLDSKLLKEFFFLALGIAILFLIISLPRVRFHYGHPDIFDRLFHLTRGGVSKASKIINLSEDIFAGIKLLLLLLDLVNLELFWLYCGLSYVPF